MKKLLAGCLVILALGAVIAVTAGYFLYQAAAPVVENARNYLSNLSALEDASRDIRNTGPFAPPASGELDETQVQRFVRVQEQVRAALGQRFEEIDRKYQTVARDGDGGAQVSIREAVSALGEMATVFVDARRVQVAALNQENFSEEEYRWVRNRVFEAAGVEVTRMIDLKKVEEALRTGTGLEDISAPDLPKIDVPVKNRALVKPHLKKADDWLPLAFFGL